MKHIQAKQDLSNVISRKTNTRTSSPQLGSTVQKILQLQSMMGNRLTSRWLTSQSTQAPSTKAPAIQAKWETGLPKGCEDQDLIEIYQQMQENGFFDDCTVYVDKDERKIFCHNTKENIGKEYDIEWEETEFTGDELTDKLEDIQGKLEAEPADTRLGQQLEERLGTKDGEQFLKKVRNLDDIYWTLGFDDTTLANLVTAVNQGHTITTLRDIIDLNEANRNYPTVRVSEWITRHGPVSTSGALTETAHEDSIRYVNYFLGWGAHPGSSNTYKQLIRILAAIEDNTGAMTVSQSDVEYVGSHNPPSRTGFLRYTFSNGDTAVIHTHWNKNDCKLVSMHVQEINHLREKKNGFEFVNTAGFNPVSKKVLDTHNAATSARKPTTTGGKALSL